MKGEKPDFEDLATNYFSTKYDVKAAIELQKDIWDDYVTPLQSRIKELEATNLALISRMQELEERRALAEQKPHGFCVTPDSKCTMSYCDENGCNDRERLLTEQSESPVMTDIDRVRAWAKCGIYHNHGHNESVVRKYLEIVDSVLRSEPSTVIGERQATSPDRRKIVK